MASGVIFTMSQKKDDTIKKEKSTTIIKNGYVTRVFTHEELKAQRAGVLDNAQNVKKNQY